MNIIEKINEILKEASISKVNLSKYLGVSRQMVYNYLDGDDLSKIPNEKCKLLFELILCYDQRIRVTIKDVLNVVYVQFFKDNKPLMSEEFKKDFTKSRQKTQWIRQQVEEGKLEEYNCYG